MNARETQGAPSIEHLCRLSGVSRAGFYRFGEVRALKRAEADLRDKIQTIGSRSKIASTAIGESAETSGASMA